MKEGLKLGDFWIGGVQGMQMKLQLTFNPLLGVSYCQE